MKHRFGIVCVILGLALVLGAASLFAYNQRENLRAGESVRRVLPKVMEEMQSRPEADTKPLPESSEMLQVEIDGYNYIGYLSIPALELELPVMGEWDYERLKIAPCRYTGTTMDGGLVILAHNYRKHFGRISGLTAGDAVTFVDMEGQVTGYEVAAVAKIDPTAVDAVTSGGYDLTLITCTYGGQARIAVYCDQIDTDMQTSRLASRDVCGST